MKKQFIFIILCLFIGAVRSLKAQNIYTVVGTGTIGFSGDGGPATSAELYSPSAITFDPAGNYYIADEQNDVVRKVATNGTITTVAGTGGVGGFSGDGGPATSAQMNWTIAVAFDAAGNMYITDRNNERIRKVNTAGIISTYVGTGVGGYNGDGIAATTAEINQPEYVTVYANALYIADQNNNRIRKVDLGTGIITTVAGTGTAGYSGDGGPATSAEINGPYGITFDTHGNMFIGDQQNYCVREVANGTGIITTVAGTGGVTGFSGDGGLATSAQMAKITGIAVGVTGNIYIADTPNNRIRKVDKQTGIITTIVGSGVSGFSGDGGPAIAAAIHLPNGVTLDGPCGDLYFPDWANERVREIVGQDLKLNITGTTHICVGTPDTLTVYGGGGTYKWSNGDTTSTIIVTPSSTTTYSVTSKGGNCQLTADTSITVVVGSIQTPPTIYGNDTVCAGNRTTLTVSGAGSYSWSNGGTLDSIMVSPSITTTYTVNVNNGCGTTMLMATVYVVPDPIPYFVTDLTTGCAPMCVQFKDLTALASGHIIMWRWAFGNGDTLNEENPIFCYPDTGTFSPSLTVVSNWGCSHTLKVDEMITVFSKPIARFTYSPMPVTMLDSTVQFIDESTDASGIAFHWWAFGDGTGSIVTDNVENPLHTYNDTGTYCPQLVVENNRGCIDTVTNCLFVEPIYTLYIPSAFSPNGDGLNDVFKPKGTYIRSFEMYVFDRWGMQLFHSTNINSGWDGTANGGNIISQEDSYIYKISVTDWDNKPHSYVGEVTLLK